MQVTELQVQRSLRALTAPSSARRHWARGEPAEAGRDRAGWSTVPDGPGRAARRARRPSVTSAWPRPASASRPASSPPPRRWPAHGRAGSCATGCAEPAGGPYRSSARPSRRTWGVTTWRSRSAAGEPSRPRRWWRPPGARSVAWPASSTGWTIAEVHFAEEKNPRIADREICEVAHRGPRAPGAAARWRRPTASARSTWPSRSSSTSWQAQEQGRGPRPSRLTCSARPDKWSRRHHQRAGLRRRAPSAAASSPWRSRPPTTSRWWPRPPRATPALAEAVESTPDVVWMGLQLGRTLAGAPPDRLDPRAGADHPVRRDVRARRGRGPRPRPAGRCASASSAAKRHQAEAVAITEQVAWGAPVARRARPRRPARRLRRRSARQAASVQQQLAAAAPRRPTPARCSTPWPRASTPGRGRRGPGLPRRPSTGAVANALARLHRHSRAEAMAYAGRRRRWSRQG